MMKKHRWIIKKGTFEIFNIEYESFVCEDCKTERKLFLSQTKARERLLESRSCDKVIQRKAIERLRSKK